MSSDGQRFLIATKLDEPNAAPLSVPLNGASDTEKGILTTRDKDYSSTMNGFISPQYALGPCPSLGPQLQGFVGCAAHESTGVVVHGV